MISSKDGIIGFAIGDAMGVPVEFTNREKLMRNPITSMVGFMGHNVPKGTWSDDTSMTLATMDSITKANGNIITNDMADKFLEWMEQGKYTPDGKIVDIDRTTLRALGKYKTTRRSAVNCGCTSNTDNGNGSLMRMLPIVYYSYLNWLEQDKILKLVAGISSITHANEVVIMGCYMYVNYAIELLNTNNRKTAYTKIQNLDYSMFSMPTIRAYTRILDNEIYRYSIDEIKSSSYIVDTLEAILWVLINTDTYNQAIIGAINLGSDTDTIAACTGGLAGIIYGIKSINSDWKIDLRKYSEIIEICEKFDETLYKINGRENNNIPIDKNKLLRKIEIVNEDITKVPADALVCANTSGILGQGGEGNIFSSAGIELENKCKEFDVIPKGQAKVTRAYRINTKYIMHTVIPKWYDEKETNQNEILQECYKNIFRVSADYDIKSIAIPTLGIGACSAPVDIAIKIAIDGIIKNISKNPDIEKIYIVCNDLRIQRAYVEYLLGNRIGIFRQFLKSW